MKYLQTLELYIQTHLREDQVLSSSNQPKRNFCFTFVFIIIGALWGIPWIAASQAAASIFSPGMLRETASLLFAIGIVVTVGADGAWIVFALTKTRIKFKSFILLPTLLFAMLSCIPSVYASVIYNLGKLQLLALITLIVNFCYAFYGYQNLLHYMHQKILFACSQKNKETVFFNKKLEIGLQQLLESSEEINFQSISAAQLINLLLDHADRKHNVKRAFFQYISGFLMIIVSGFVDVYLIKDFFLSVFNIPAFSAMVFALICALPACVMTFIAAKNVMGKLYNFIAQRRFSNALCSQYLPYGYYISLAIFLCSLLSPTAAANIVFHTFSQAGFPNVFIWPSVIVMSMARIIFSNFTLTSLVEEVVFYLFSRTNKYHPTVERRKKLLSLQAFLKQVC